MIDWGPDKFALIGGLVVAGSTLAFAAYELRLWRRKRRDREADGPEEEFRAFIHNFNRLDQSVSADSLASMPSKGSRTRRD